MKLCSKCKETKLSTEFSNNVSKKDGKQNWCKSCFQPVKQKYYQNHKKLYRDQCRRSRLKNRQYVFDYFKTHPCVDCGETDPVVLTFDHVRGKKRFNISKARSQGFALKTLKDEIAKCEIRCCNCHARRTAKQFNYYKDLI